MSDQDAGEASRDDPLWDCLEARFPPEAFEPIARALEKSIDRPSLEALKDWLLPTFCSFYASCTTDKRYRTEREKELRRRNKAAGILLTSLRSRWFLGEPSALLDKAFRTKFLRALESSRSRHGAAQKEGIGKTTRFGMS